MDKLIEEISFRNEHYIFEDRKEAGKLLAKKMIKYKESHGIVFGIPSGGAPVAREVADTLKWQMDLIIVRKLQIPYNPEAGFGAMGPDGEIVLNKSLLNQIRLSKDEIKTQTKSTMDVIERRNKMFRRGKSYSSLKNEIVIVVDDGLASGYTMLAAVRFLKKRFPRKIIVAVPTGSRNTIDFVLPEVDELVCLNVRTGFSFAVADAYKNWHDLTDEEVISVIKEQP